MYKDYVINKEEYQKSAKLQQTYSTIAKWCNKTGQFSIVDDGENYVVKENPDYQKSDNRDFRSEFLNAQMADTTYEEISPTTYLNVMIKL